MPNNKYGWPTHHDTCTSPAAANLQCKFAVSVITMFLPVKHVCNQNQMPGILRVFFFAPELGAGTMHVQFLAHARYVRGQCQCIYICKCIFLNVYCISHWPLSLLYTKNGKCLFVRWTTFTAAQAFVLQVGLVTQQSPPIHQTAWPICSTHHKQPSIRPKQKQEKVPVWLLLKANPPHCFSRELSKPRSAVCSPKMQRVQPSCQRRDCRTCLSARKTLYLHCQQKVWPACSRTDPSTKRQKVSLLKFRPQKWFVSLIAHPTYVSASKFPAQTTPPSPQGQLLLSRS